MLVALQLKMPIELADKLREKLFKLTDIHKIEADPFFADFAGQSQRAAVLGDENMLKSLGEKMTELNTRAKRLTINNVIRAVIEEGIKAWEGKDQELLTHITENGVSRGRPKES